MYFRTVVSIVFDYLRLKTNVTKKDDLLANQKNISLSSNEEESFESSKLTLAYPPQPSYQSQSQVSF